MKGPERIARKRSYFKARDCILVTASSAGGHFTPHISSLWIKQSDKVVAAHEKQTCVPNEKYTLTGHNLH